MVNFTNPGILGDASYFRRYYQVSHISFISTRIETYYFVIGLNIIGQYFHVL